MCACGVCVSVCVVSVCVCVCVMCVCVWGDKGSGSWKGKKFVSSASIQISFGTHLSSCLGDSPTYALWSKEARA